MCTIIGMTNKIYCVTVGAIAANCWLYLMEEKADSRGNRPCVVIDPGDEAETIISCLRELSWIPRFVFLTHGHFDHTAALPDLLAAFGDGGVFSGSPLPKTGIHRLDAHYLDKDALDLQPGSFAAAGGKNGSYIKHLWKAPPPGDIFFEEGGKAGPFTVLHLPGHTPGSAAFYSEKDGVLFSGDTLFKGTWGRTDLPGGNEEDMRQSLARLRSLEGDTLVCPGHGPPTTIKDEAENVL